MPFASRTVSWVSWEAHRCTEDRAEHAAVEDAHLRVAVATGPAVLVLDIRHSVLDRVRGAGAKKDRSEPIAKTYHMIRNSSPASTQIPSAASTLRYQVSPTCDDRSGAQADRSTSNRSAPAVGHLRRSACEKRERASDAPRLTHVVRADGESHETHDDSADDRQPQLILDVVEAT
eukprot:scaffold8536_cov248-Pinguiococcus_pyrenoidosus.AAC.8